jgi:hypothetical protein
LDSMYWLWPVGWPLAILPVVGVGPLLWCVGSFT